MRAIRAEALWTDDDQVGAILCEECGAIWEGVAACLICGSDMHRWMVIVGTPMWETHLERLRWWKFIHRLHVPLRLRLKDHFRARIEYLKERLQLL